MNSPAVQEPSRRPEHGKFVKHSLEEIRGDAEVILTGMRPSGSLHLGHYVGALENWKRIQDATSAKCHFLIADYQVFGDYVHDIERIRKSVRDVTVDWLAIGLDPERSNFVVQSYVPEFAELALYLSMFTPLSRVMNNPTLKAEMKQIEERKDGESGISLGFFNYPVSQAADILLPQATLIPVGDDQIPHIELTRQIIQKVNKVCGSKFPLPDALVGRVARLVGVDGQAKMSKSLGNAIMLSEPSDTLRKKVNKMYTDPTRLKATDPGHTEGNVVFTYLDAFYENAAELEEMKARYRAGKMGDGETKAILFDAMERLISPIRERRKAIESDDQLVSRALESGAERFRPEASKTMKELKEFMNINAY